MVVQSDKTLLLEIEHGRVVECLEGTVAFDRPRVLRADGPNRPLTISSATAVDGGRRLALWSRDSAPKHSGSGAIVPCAGADAMTFL